MDEKTLMMMVAGLASLMGWYIARRMRPSEELPSVAEKLALYIGLFLLIISLGFGVREQFIPKNTEKSENKLQKYQQETSGCAGKQQHLKSYKKVP